eukprot:TRINITY_DN4039_c0_g1_i1.p2 TRINITY_DN4039_c0_g1~~TRINITY_DN4039_c0_g1_i1.p2  ORF type:complete len:140 (-),score=1.68 TRINITY_DN4039_c0_g1_i1:162-581(-)
MQGIRTFCQFMFAQAQIKQSKKSGNQKTIPNTQRSKFTMPNQKQQLPPPQPVKHIEKAPEPVKEIYVTPQQITPAPVNQEVPIQQKPSKIEKPVQEEEKDSDNSGNLLILIGQTRIAKIHLRRNLVMKNLRKKKTKAKK